MKYTEEEIINKACIEMIKTLIELQFNLDFNKLVPEHYKKSSLEMEEETEQLARNVEAYYQKQVSDIVDSIRSMQRILEVNSVGLFVDREEEINRLCAEDLDGVYHD